MKRIIISFAAFCALGLLVVAGVVFSGLISVAADDPHTGVVHAFLETARNRSIEVRSEDIVVPSLDDEDQIRAGAGNYDSMCVGCHLAPGMAETELSNGLYPAPPSLAEAGLYGDPAKHFGSSSMASRPLGCLRGVKAWLTRTSGEWWLFCRSFLS